MKVAIVGLGYWGSKVLGEYADLRDEGTIDAVVACDQDPTALESADRADETRGDVAEILPEVDALHVCTTDETHFPIATMAIESGTDVLLEKPLTTDREQAFDLVQLASEQGQILQTGHIFRFANVIRTAREYYQKGYFGTVHTATLRWTHRLDRIRGTDVLWDLMCHPIDILNFVTDDWPRNPEGVALHDPGLERPVGATTTFEIAEGMGTVEVSWVDDVRRRTLEIAGTKRSGTIECVDQSMTVTDTDGTETIAVEANNTIRAEAENFVSAIETRENTFNSAIVGARTVDAIDRIHAAVEPVDGPATLLE